MMDSSNEVQQEEAKTRADTPEQLTATESQRQDTEQNDSPKHEHGVATNSSLDCSLQENQATTVSVDVPVQPQALPPTASSSKTVNSNIAPFPELKTLRLANNLVITQLLLQSIAS